MLIAGILGSEGKLQTAGIISSILSSKGEKVSVLDSATLLGMDGNRLKAYISELEKNNVDLLLLKTELSDIDNFLSEEVKFDILIYTDKADDSDIPDDNEYSRKFGQIFSRMNEKGIAIVNVDDCELIKLLQGMKYRFVTYGFNTKASVTTSSIGDSVYKDGFICCLQRSISARDGKVVEPQEYKLHFEGGELDSHNLLAAASFAIVNGIDLNNLNENLTM
ncbi:MAG TPA: Mur ligase family protein [Clostridia bacterium]|nr:Mur ligase family protein [Clostridia bacterium]